ncbi:uncharacterized protein JCM6883_005761 [Sporobolomyces salmoneus]|uniref:uncharacterized protein n=1 Tax=Sporobolomyces salmoneus TaxID=183962 RepID=UPI0031766771
MNLHPTPAQHAPSRSPDPILHPSDASDDDSSTSLPRASVSRSSDRHSRVVQPQILKHPSLLANIRKTWNGYPESTTTHPFENRQSLRESSARRVDEFASVEGVAGDEDYEEKYSDDMMNGRRATNSEMGDRVLCARWATLNRREGDQNESRRILLIAYKNGAFAIWDCSSLDSWFELVSLRSLERALDSKLEKRYSRGIGSVVDFVVLPSDSVAIVTRRAKSSSSHVLLYSLEAHRIVTAFDVPGTAHRLAVNGRFLVVSTSNPLALHVLSVSSLEPIPCSPLTDLVPSSFDGSPVFSLGSGGRLLAYATDRAIPSSRLDRSPAKPGAGLLAHSGLFDTESATPTQSATEFLTRSQGSGTTLMNEAGQVGEQVARKVSEGVMSGVKAIGEVGMSYWMSKSTNGNGGQSSSRRESTLSKSAPANTVAGFGRRFSTTNAFSPSANSSTALDSTTSAVAGTVIVIDLVASSSSSASTRAARSGRTPSASSVKVISHFRPYPLPLALVSFSPSSTSLLTASTPSHHFDIFELHPSNPIGNSALLSVPSSSDSNSGKVWHRYRLQRGYTSARATSATWSDDGRFVAVGTGKGTAHVYAIQPMGGTPSLESHFDPKVKNLNDLPPLSVNLSSIARVRPSSTTLEDISPSSTQIAFPSFAFVSKADSHASSFRPTHSTSSSFSPHLRSASSKSAPVQDLLVFYPSSTTAQLHRLSVSQSVASPSSAAVAAASRGDVGKLATTAVSGLTQLMKTRGGFGGIGAGSGGGGPLNGSEQKKELVPSCSAKAEWQLMREDDEEDVKEIISLGSDRTPRKRVPGSRWSAFAEIETFSRSPRVLPRSVYESQQFTFYALPIDFTTSTLGGKYGFPQARKLEMRSQVVIRSSSHENHSPSTSPSDLSFEPASFDQPIRTAMQTVLDQEAILAPGSPKLPAPSFPVGVAAKQGSWRDSVRPAAIEGLDRVRQGLGRVRLPKAGDLVDAARRRRSLIGSSGQVAYSSSISFDDNEAVFADRLSVDEMGSASTACTSEGEEGQMAKDGVEDWGWDEPIDEVSIPSSSSKPSPSPLDDALSQPLFDDADFDNFELELSVPPIAPAKLPSPTSSIAVELPSSVLNPASSGNRNLAPPVSINANPNDSDSIAASPSLRPLNPLLDIHKPSTSISPSSSPSSVVSTTSSSGGGGGKKKKRK